MKLLILKGFSFILQNSFHFKVYVLNSLYYSSDDFRNISRFFIVDVWHTDDTSFIFKIEKYFLWVLLLLYLFIYSIHYIHLLFIIYLARWDIRPFSATTWLIKFWSFFCQDFRWYMTDDKSFTQLFFLKIKIFKHKCYRHCSYFLLKCFKNSIRALSQLNFYSSFIIIGIESA